jgi:hypothetical protein
MSVWSEAAKDRDRAVAGWIYPFADGSLSGHRNGYVGNRPAVWTTLPTDGTPWILSGALIHPSRRLVTSPPVDRAFRRAARLLFQLFPDAVVDSFARTVLLLI